MLNKFGYLWMIEIDFCLMFPICIIGNDDQILNNGKINLFVIDKYNKQLYLFEISDKNMYLY